MDQPMPSTIIVRFMLDTEPTIARHALESAVFRLDDLGKISERRVSPYAPEPGWQEVSFSLSSTKDALPALSEVKERLLGAEGWTDQGDADTPSAVWDPQDSVSHFFPGICFANLEGIPD